MPAFRRPSFPPTRGGRRARIAGFSLVELSVVVFIISLLVAIAVPTLKKVQFNSRATTVANDLRVFSSALQHYVQEKGEWPGGGSEPGVFPPGMDGYLRESNWARPTPIGGRYTWAPNSWHQGERHRAAIVISTVAGSPVTEDRNQLIDLDRKIDDGNLETGNLRLGFRNYPVFVLEH
ncbi:MAG: type II secretion system protein [Verrucomicrobia bacterium]|nr:type II secretion system protein [Verrucomicrobiota bacterium]